MNALTSWLGQHAHLWAVALLIVGVVLHYLLRFVAPALRLKHTLAEATERLAALQARAASEGVDLAQIAQEVMTEPRLAHLWRQYAHGLHPHWGVGSQPAPASVQPARANAGADHRGQPRAHRAADPGRPAPGQPVGRIFRGAARPAAGTGGGGRACAHQAVALGGAGRDLFFRACAGRLAAAKRLLQARAWHLDRAGHHRHVFRADHGPDPL